MTVQVERGWVPADSFGQRLMLVRRSLGLSVKEIALATGFHYATWSTWENGRLPSDVLDVVRRLSDTYGVDRDWLLWGGAFGGGPSQSVQPKAPYLRDLSTLRNELTAIPLFPSHAELAA